MKPGFLIGGVPSNFDSTARLGEGTHFVVEADEYDTAFFDKRAKFVHYRPRTAVLNNLEHDHADIYPDVAAIQWQFHQLLRMVPRQGLVVANAGDAHVMEVLDMGCWTPVERFSADLQGDAAWYALAAPGSDYSTFSIMEGNRHIANVEWPLIGKHNAQNALAALLAARHAGVSIEAGVAALKAFEGVRRRLQTRGVVRGVTVYDDFAHHPTAIETTIDGLRRRIGSARMIAVLEPRSNTMKLGTHREALARSLAGADEIFMYQGPSVQWDVAEAVSSLGSRAHVSKDLEALVETLANTASTGDHVLIMSNGGFGGIHEKLLARLREQR